MVREEKGSKAKEIRGEEKEEAALEAKVLVEKDGAEKEKATGAAKEKAGDTRETLSIVIKRDTKQQSAGQPRKTPTW